MPRMHDPIEVAKEHLHDMHDRPDPALNYIEAVDRLIKFAEMERDRRRADQARYGTDYLLEPFEDKYEAQRQGESNDN